MEQENFPNGFERKDNNSFLYEIEAWITLQCNMNWVWIEFKYIEWKLNSTKFDSSSIIGLTTTTTTLGPLLVLAAIANTRWCRTKHCTTKT